MKVTSTYLIAAGAGALIIATMFGISLWANHKIGSLERDVEQAKDVAAEKQSVAEQLELRSTDYKAKTEYLEQQIAELSAIAKKQDDELQTLSKNISTARIDVEPPHAAFAQSPQQPKSSAPSSPNSDTRVSSVPQEHKPDHRGPPPQHLRAGWQCKS